MNDTKKMKDIIKKLSFEHHLNVEEIANFLEVDSSVVREYLDLIKTDELNSMLNTSRSENFENKKNM